MARNIPGITGCSRTDLAVLKPFRLPGKASHEINMANWLATLPPWTGLVLFLPLLLWPFTSHAAGSFTVITAFGILTKWIPFLLKSGFLFNIIISLFSMLFGTIAASFWDLHRYQKLPLSAGHHGLSHSYSGIRPGW